MLTIENGVLVKCDENATEVVIPADITEIESNAFKECKALKILRFPKEFDFKYLYENPDVYGTNDFNCYWDIDTFFIDSLTDVYYEGSIVEWIESTGYLLFKENVKIHCTDGDVASLAPDMEKIVIPAGVSVIPDYAFFDYRCKEIEIPDSVTDIGEYAFCKTSNLKTITFPAGLKSIGLRAFVESGIETINFKGTIEQWKKVCMDEPWDTSYDIWLMEVGTVHCSDGDTDFDDLLYIRNNCIVEVTYLYDGHYSIPIDIEAISEKAFGRLDNECELNYEGTKEQWFKIDKGVDWDCSCVTVVHCSNGDIQINKGNKDLNEKLINAVSEGNLEEVKKMIIEGASVNAANDSWGTALDIALRRDFKEIAEFLIKQGSDVTRISKSTFDLVVDRGSKELVELLLAHGVNVNVDLGHGRTALMIAASKSNKEMLELLIKHGANINAADESGYTALMVAAKHNKKEITKFLVERGADVNAAMDDGRTALMIAASRSNKEMLELLIEHGADINARTKLGETPLMWCSYSERNAVTLIEHGADVNAVNKQGTSTYEMFIDFYGKDSGIVEFLVQHGAKTNVHNLFIEAIKNNNTDEVLKFINNGANLNLSFHIPSEYTPLMVAAQYDSKEVAELLIEHGAEVNHEPIELDGGAYYFPLSAAAEWNAKNVAEVLINHGAWFDLDDAYDRADNKGEDDVFDFDEAYRPWDYAIINNSKDVIEVFLNHGYECYSVKIYNTVEDSDDEEGSYEEDYENPISYAEEHNFTELAELLKKRLKKS